MASRSRAPSWRFPASAGMAFAIAVACAASCTKSDTTRPGDGRPNVLWVVWDTVRADRLGLYGHSAPTTPHLEAWAKDARVFENCVSTASHTVPAHASMFTGLFTTEHGAHNDHLYLDDRFTTLAELLRADDYQTYMYSANPHISRARNFHRGFEVQEHPWDAEHKEQAARIVRGKVPAHDRSSELSGRLRLAGVRAWNIKASGELAQRSVQEWLGRRDPSRPFFIFLNYMEAHRPYIPPEPYRRQVMSADRVARTYTVDRSWPTMWDYIFGFHEYSQDDLDTIAALYDAALAELDDLFHDLLRALDSGGYLDNTIVILTSDHGEHLGEHHLLDHQYSLYQPLIRVPLIVRFPERFPPGREPRPVMNFDIFPTVLELVGIDPPSRLASKAKSLLAPRADRIRFAEYPAHFPVGIKTRKRKDPRWDSRPWERKLRALLAGDYKYIWASDGRHELYNTRVDPAELKNLFADEPETSQGMQDLLDAYLASLAAPGGAPQPVPTIPEDLREQLHSLGYIAGPDEAAGPEASTNADRDVSP